MTRDELQEDIVSSLPSAPHGLLLLAPRIGKSKIALDIIKKEESKSILWVTPNSNLRDTAIPKEFNTWGMEEYLERTLIVCWKSLEQVSGHFDLVIFDEYQYATPVNTAGLFNMTITFGHIIGLSGTHPQHEEKQEIYDTLNLSVLRDMTIDEAVENDLLADYNVHVVNVPIEKEVKEIVCGKPPNQFKQTEYNNYVYLDNRAEGHMTQRNIMARLRAVYKSPSKEKVARWMINQFQGRKLVFCGSIEQADRLSPHSFHSKSKGADKENLQRFIDGEFDTLTCVNSGGIGTTYSNVDHFIIIQSNSDKRGDTTQKLARSLLKQGDYVANIWILCLEQTKDVTWVHSALESFNQDKIRHVGIFDLMDELTEVES